MNLIITMAGKYLRFKKAGYAIPKFLLPLRNGHTVFQEIMEQFVSGYDFENIIFVANTEDLKHKKAIVEAIKACGIQQYDLIFIRDTKGQAETALMGIDELKKKQCNSNKVIIHNIDTVLYDRDIQQIDTLLDKYSGYIDVFEANEDCYSYVKTADNQIITEIKEKKVISNKATTGLYAFSDMDVYRRYYQQLKTDKEYYISFIYELMLRDKKEITINSRTAKTIILGTPEEYERYTSTSEHL